MVSCSFYRIMWTKRKHSKRMFTFVVDLDGLTPSTLPPYLCLCPRVDSDELLELFKKKQGVDFRSQQSLNTRWYILWILLLLHITVQLI